MKALTASAMLLILAAVAFAKPTPVKLPNRALVRADINIGKNPGKGASARERDYFKAQQLLFNSGDFRCQLKPVLFNGARPARLCR